MSGRRRELSLEWVLRSVTAVVLVDPRTFESEKTSADVPYETPEGEKRSFAFGFACGRVNALEVLWAQGAVDITQPLRVVSESVQRSKHWHYRVERDGARKIMYYDECAAFDEPATGATALLLLKGHDSSLDAHCAAMGDGVLPVSYREQVMKAVTDGSDAADAELPSPPSV